MTIQQLNQRAAHLTAFARSRCETLRIRQHETHGAGVLDFGVDCEGGLEAGLLLARICLSGMAQVELMSQDAGLLNVPRIFVQTDHLVAACLMSQYAGWKVATSDYFAMGSGPMRALARKEELFQELPETENGRIAAGVLEASGLPTSDAIATIQKISRRSLDEYSAESQRRAEVAIAEGRFSKSLADSFLITTAFPRQRAKSRFTEREGSRMFDRYGICKS